MTRHPHSTIRGLFALQPLLLRLRRERADRSLRVADTAGRTVELTVRSASLADAVASAVRHVESEGRRVRTLEILEQEHSSPNGSAPR